MKSGLRVFDDPMSGMSAVLARDVCCLFEDFAFGHLDVHSDIHSRSDEWLRFCASVEG